MLNFTLKLNEKTGPRRCCNTVDPRALTPIERARGAEVIMADSCKVEDCGREARAIGLCSRCLGRHYRRLKGAKPRNMSEDPVVRIKSRIIETPSGCWEWQGSRGPQGYGALRFQGKAWSPHRLAYTCLVGPIPDGLALDHLCRNPSCCNPEHLEPVTTAENNRRAAIANWTPLEHGTVVGYVSRKCRCDECRAAMRDYMRAYRAARRHAQASEPGERP